jgi:DNA polymerase elongation subunit (family B)
MKMIAHGERFFPNMKVAYIVTKDSSPLEVEPYFREGQQLKYDPKYYERRILDTVEDLFVGFGYDRDSIKTGTKQTGLDTYGSGTSSAV